MTGISAARNSGRRIAQSDTLELAIPECERGLGKVIGAIDLTDDAAGLIAGVRLDRLQVHPDDRGYFLELHRLGRGLAAEFPAASSQISAALSYPGAIKAFHYHLHQTDCWNPIKGLLQVALVDLRLSSPTFGLRNTMYLGPLRPWQVLIPPGVAHGYKVIGSEEAMLVYMTDRFYNPEDEGRIPYNDAAINYDWETQRK